MFLSSPVPTQTSSEIYFASDLSRRIRLLQNHRVELASPEILAIAETEISNVIDTKGIETLSFDVFDTALLRSPICEARRFFEVSKAFAAAVGKFSTEDALLGRIYAARAAYAYANPSSDDTREGQFSVIAEIVCRQLQVPDRVPDYVRMELEYERRTLVPNPLIQHLDRRFADLKIIFISDMYLDRHFIHQLVAEHYGPAIVYSSGDGYGSKRSGGLFRHIAQEENIHLHSLLHFGDSLEGDYRSLRRLGGNSIYLPIPDAERKAREQCYSSLTEELATLDINLASILPFNC